MSKEEEEERINNLLVEARLLESTYSELSARQSLLERAVIENRAALETLEALGSSVKEVLIPVGGGVFLKSEPPASERVLVNVGSNVVLEKSKEDATKILEDRTKELEENVVSLITQRNQVAQRLESDRRALQTLVARQQGPTQ